MLAEQVRQNQLSNDLSNSSTPGYKVDHAEQQSFGSLLLSNTATGQRIGTLDTGVKIAKIVTDMTPATLQQTGQPLDFGIQGTGFFAVSTPNGVRYTRDGQFMSNAQGRLVESRLGTDKSASRATRRAAPSRRRVLTTFPLALAPSPPAATCAKTNRSFSRSLRSTDAFRAARPWGLSSTQHRIVPRIGLPARGRGYSVASSALARHRVSTGSRPRLGRDPREPMAGRPRRNAA